MRLVCQTAFNGNLAQGFFCVEHEPLRSLHAPPDDISVRWLPDTITEYNIEVEHTEASHCREILVSDLRIQVRVDMGKHSTDLPWREAFPCGVFAGDDIHV